jgi:hypothetical protein
MIGKPYVERGCILLVLAWAARFGWHVTEDRETWEPCAPIPGCAASLSWDRISDHVGIYLGGKRFLHTRRSTGSVIQRLPDAMVVGYYAPKS